MIVSKREWSVKCNKLLNTTKWQNVSINYFDTEEEAKRYFMSAKVPDRLHTYAFNLCYVEESTIDTRRVDKIEMDKPDLKGV